MCRSAKAPYCRRVPQSAIGLQVTAGGAMFSARGKEAGDGCAMYSSSFEDLESLRLYPTAHTVNPKIHVSAVCRTNNACPPMTTCVLPTDASRETALAGPPTVGIAALCSVLESSAFLKSDLRRSEKCPERVQRLKSLAVETQKRGAHVCWCAETSSSVAYSVSCTGVSCKGAHM